MTSTERQLQLEFHFSNTIEVDEAPSRAEGVAIDTRFPTEEANLLAERETFNKHLFRPNTYLHKWWARRSGTTFRYILKQLSDTSSGHDYYAIGGLQGKIILDPMIGGGTTIHEAIRLGASVIGYDIDPIPVLQAKATLTYIPLKEKTAIFKKFFERLEKILNPFFTTTCPRCNSNAETQFILYGLRKKCQCGEALFVDSLQLREEPDGSGIELCPYTGLPYQGTPPVVADQARRLIYDKNIRKCPTCGEVFQELRDELYVNRYAPLVIVGHCTQHKQFFKKPSEADIQHIEQARIYSAANICLPKNDLTVSGGPKSDDLLHKGISNYADLFTHRQLIYLAASKDILDTFEEKHQRWLGMIVSTSLEFNCLLCGYKGAGKRRPGAIRHVFSHHAYSFPYTALENNPVFSGNTSGTIGLLFRDRIRAASLWAEKPVERKHVHGTWTKVSLTGEHDWGIQTQSFDEIQTQAPTFLVMQQDSSHLPLPAASVDHVVTDPPYYDSVQYSDLAQFFRVWLRWFLPGEGNWDYSVANSAVAETTQNGAKYQQILAAIWSECHRVLKKPSGRLIFTFHHWRPEAWGHLTLSLKKAKFRLVTSYTIQSENPISVHIRQLQALKHDSILVLAPSESLSADNRFCLPEMKSTQDSFMFCNLCATILGYCLDSDLSEHEIIEFWHKSLGTES
ncbi:MAG: hypothetical protein EXR62_11095 [Chloroflexi bacterium]|nr:hypothetical protein [Chloroflexota bacterium]